MDQKSLPAVLITVLSLACLLITIRGLWLALRRTAFPESYQKKIVVTVLLVITAWVLLTGFLAGSGFFSDFSKLPPRPLLLIFLPLAGLLILAFSKTGTAIIRAIPPHWLVGMQAFRILVELLLWRLCVGHLLPVQMSFEGNNFDVISGLLAIPVAMILYRKWMPQLSLFFNVIGIGLLINILVIAVLSMPTPFRYFRNEPSNTLVTEFPFVYLPAVLVALAQALHIFSLRQVWLLRKEK